jgi:hypothetical protein
MFLSTTADRDTPDMELNFGELLFHVVRCIRARGRTGAAKSPGPSGLSVLPECYGAGLPFTVRK